MASADKLAVLGGKPVLGPDAVKSLEAFVAHEDATRDAGLRRALGSLERLDPAAARRAAKKLETSARFDALSDPLKTLVRRLAG